MQNLFKRSILFKINAFTSLFFLFTIFIVSFISYTQNKKIINNVYLQAGEKITRSAYNVFIKGISHQTFNDSITIDSEEVRKNIYKVFDDFSDNPEIEMITFWDNQYNVIESTKNEFIDSIRIKLIYEDLVGNPFLEINKRRYLVFKRTLYLPDSHSYKKIGYLTIVMNFNNYLNEKQRNWILMFALLSLLVIFVAIFNYVLIKYIMFPIERIREGMKSLYKGNTKVIKESSYFTEVNEISKLYNNLAKKFDEIEQKTQETVSSLSSQENIYKSLLNNAPIGIALFSHDGELIESNKHLMDILGFDDVLEIKKVNLFTFKFFLECGLVHDVRKAIKTLRSVANEAEFISSAITTKYLKYIITPISQLNQETKILLTIEDVTEEKKSQSEQQIIRELTRKLLEKNELVEIGDVAAWACYELFKYDAFSFDIYDRRNHFLIGLISQDTPDDADKPKEYAPANNKPVSDTTLKVLSGEPILVNKIDSNKRYFASSFGEVQKMSSSFMVVPIRHQNQTLGIISVHSYTENYFNEANLLIFSNIANLCAEPINRINFGKKKAVINELLEQLNKPFNLNNFGKMIAETIRKLFLYDSFYFCIKNIDDDKFTLSYAEETSIHKLRPEYYSITDIPLHPDVTNTIIDAIPYLDNSDEQLISGLTSVDGVHRKSEMATGIYWNNQMVGFILIQSFREDYYEDIDLLELQEVNSNLGGIVARLIMENSAMEKSNQLKQMIKQRTNLLVDEISNRVMLEDKLTNIINASLDAIIGVNYDGSIKLFNSSAEEMFGWKKEDILGLPIQTIIPQTGNNRSLNKMIDLILLNKQKNYKTGTFSVLAKKSNGKSFEVEISASVSFEDDNPVLIAIVHDISEKKKINDYSKDLAVVTQENSRLSVMSEIASGISREIKKPLFKIDDINKALMTDIKNYHTNKEKIIKGILENQSNLDRIKAMLSYLDVFSKNNYHTEDHADFYQIFENIRLLMNEQLLMHDINLSITFDDNLPVVPLNNNQLEQILLNVLQNSIDALIDKEDKKITIKLKQSVDNKSLIIQIKDNGIGIKSEILNNIFEPFFTTKEDKMGLGLTIANSILQSVNGHIFCHSKVNVGTTFTLEIPVL